MADVFDFVIFLVFIGILLVCCFAPYLLKYRHHCESEETLQETDEVLDFISNFKGSETTFLYGCCYWFAFILHRRFAHSAIKLLPVENHFVTEIEGRLYDVSGDVTEQYKNSKILYWDEVEESDELYYKSIVHHCVKKVKMPNE